jgi:hypothetical protein
VTAMRCELRFVGHIPSDRPYGRHRARDHDSKLTNSDIVAPDCDAYLCDRFVHPVHNEQDRRYSATYIPRVRC